jgi:6-phosphogluconolactonase/glucosamine-6-phosphate isomerase/deaminase
MPSISRGITLGLADIKAARLIHLLVLGSHKKEITNRLLACTKVDPYLPASVLLELESAVLILDKAASG